MKNPNVLLSIAALVLIGLTGYTIVFGGETPTSVSAPQQPPPGQSPAPVRIIVDNAGPSFSIQTGDWGTCKEGECGGVPYGADFRYAEPGCTSCRARFDLKVTITGNYDVYAWWPRGEDRATDTPFTIVYSGGSVTVNVNQRKQGSGWYLLRMLALRAGEPVSVAVGGSTTGYANADAIAVTLAGSGPQPKPTDDQTLRRNLILPTPPSGGGGSFQFVMGIGYYAPPNVAMPPKGTYITDSNFHTKIVRVTDKKSDGYSGPGIQNEYAKSDPENSDGTLITLRGNNGSWYLYNASTYQMIKRLTVFDSCGWEEPEPRWDASNPKIFYYLCSTYEPNKIELRSYNIDTDTSTTIHNFKKEFPSAASITTNTEGDASLDRRYWCFMVQDPDYNLLSVIVYDKTLNKIVGQKDGGFPDTINWVGMSVSGNHCVIGYDNLTYAQIFSRNLKSSVTLPDGSNGHGDLARTADGKDVLVYQNVGTDYIAMADLNTGTETPLVAIPFSINTDIGLHFSGNCSQTPGWVLVSTYGSKNPPPDRSHSWMDTQLFMVELKANPRIWRIAHTYSYTSLNYTGDKNYFAEAFAAINTNGTKMYFGSNWENFATDYTDTYQVILPDGWISSMPK